MKKLNVPEIIDALGGPVLTASQLGLSHSTVSRWRSGAVKPRKYHLQNLIDAYEHRRFTLCKETLLKKALEKAGSAYKLSLALNMNATAVRSWFHRKSEPTPTTLLVIAKFINEGE
jgi:DNA-binding transcriptional regulator YiaG